MRGLSRKTVLVTGGGGAIGSALCRRFAEEGAAVLVCDRNGEAAQRVAREVNGKALVFDIARYAEAKAAVGATPVDVLVNNAGWDRFQNFVDTKPEEWEELIAVNLRGPLNMHHLLAPAMASRGWGRIVNIASDAARVGSSGEAVYAACKGGLVSFSKTIAREHARHGITVNVVCPGPTDTALFADYKEGAGNPEKLMEAFTRSIPLGRIGQPGDLPGAVLFFASEDAAYVTGQVLSVSGGLTMNG
jgi:2-hydroxycyclohexanecarboxyl-CoA dehydrogenase